MEQLQLIGLSGALVPFAITSGGYTSVAVVAMGDSETITMVGGASMYPSKNIIQNTVNSKDHTTLVAAVKAGDLAGTPSGTSPLTVFIPTNEAFVALSAGTVDKSLEPENKSVLIEVLTYYVVPGRLAAQDLTKAIAGGGGKAMFKTAEGDPLTIMQKGDRLAVAGDKDGIAMVTIGNAYQSDSVVHVMDKVLTPQLFPWSAETNVLVCPDYDERKGNVIPTSLRSGRSLWEQRRWYTSITSHHGQPGHAKSYARCWSTFA